jgi:phosphopentomutase
MIAYSPSLAGSGKIPERDTFAALGATIAANFGVKMPESAIGEPMNELL